MKYSQRLARLLPRVLRRHKIIFQLVRLFPGERIQRFAFDHSEIVADLRFPEGREPFIKGSFADHGYFDLACELLPQGGVHFDVGANFGFHTFGICRLLKDRSVHYHMFEPNSFCVDCHRLSALLFENAVFTMNHVALGSFEQNVELVFDPGHTGGGFVQGGLDLIAAKSLPSESLWKQKVRQITFDDYLRNTRLNRVDFCKVDIEGAEPDFLIGARDSLGNGKVGAMYMEVSTETLARVGKKPAELYGLLESCGFHLVFPHRKPEGTWAAYQGVSRWLEFTDFSPKLADAQFDVLALHESSKLWKSRKKSTSA